MCLFDLEFCTGLGLKSNSVLSMVKVVDSLYHLFLKITVPPKEDSGVTTCLNIIAFSSKPAST